MAQVADPDGAGSPAQGASGSVAVEPPTRPSAAPRPDASPLLRALQEPRGAHAEPGDPGTSVDKLEQGGGNSNGDSPSRSSRGSGGDGGGAGAPVAPVAPAGEPDHAKPRQHVSGGKALGKFALGRFNSAGRLPAGPDPPKKSRSSGHEPSGPAGQRSSGRAVLSNGEVMQIVIEASPPSSGQPGSGRAFTRQGSTASAGDEDDLDDAPLEGKEQSWLLRCSMCELPCCARLFPTLSSSCDSLLRHRKVRGVLCVIGFALIIAGAVLLAVTPYDRVAVPLALVLIGAFCSFGLLVSLLIGIVLVGLEAWQLRWGGKSSLHVMADTTIHYLLAVRPSLENLLWVLATLVTFAVVFPLWQINEWNVFYVQVVRLLVVLFMFFLARVLTVFCRIYISQSFNTRAYHDKVTTTIWHEHVLNVLLNKVPNAWFKVMFGKIDSRCFESKSSDLSRQAVTVIDPRTWQQLVRYINQHHVDGVQLEDGYMHGHVQANEDVMKFAAERTYRMADKLFERLFAFCEARRALRRVRESADADKSADTLPLPATGTGKGSGTGSGGSNSGGGGGDLAGASLVTIVGLQPPPERLQIKALSSPPPPRSDTELEAFTSGSTAELLGHTGSPGGGKGAAARDGESASLDGRRYPRRRTGIIDYFHSRESNEAPDSPSPVHATSNAQMTYNQNSIAASPSQKNRDRRKLRKQDVIELLDEYYGQYGINAAVLWSTLFDPAGSGFTTHSRVRKMLVSVFAGRRNISATLQDAHQVLTALDSFIFTALLFVVTMISLAIYSIDVLQLWLGLSSALLAWSFVFGSTVRVAFEALVFLFLINPYNVGDVIEIGPARDRYEVRRISLFSTELLSWDGSITVMPNQSMATATPIYNFNISEKLGRVQKFQVDCDVVTDEFMRLLNEDMIRFLREPDNAARFTMDYCIHARDFKTPFKLELSIFWQHAYPNLSIGRSYADQDVMIRFLNRQLLVRGARVSGVGLGWMPRRATDSPLRVEEGGLSSQPPQAEALGSLHPARRATYLG